MGAMRASRNCDKIFLASKKNVLIYLEFVRCWVIVSGAGQYNQGDTQLTQAKEGGLRSYRDRPIPSYRSTQTAYSKLEKENDLSFSTPR